MDSEQTSEMKISKDYFNLKGKNAEQLVQDLALKTFLTDWCYLNATLPSGKDLIESKRVNYVPLSVNKIGIAEHIDTGESGE